MSYQQTNLNCIAKRVRETMKVARRVPESEVPVLHRITQGLQDELLNASNTMDEPGVRVPRILLSLRRLFNDDQVWDQPSKAQLVTVSSEDPDIKTCPEYIDMETDDESVGPDPWWTQDIEIQEPNNNPSKECPVGEKRKRRTVLSRPLQVQNSDESESDVQPKKPKRREIKAKPKAQQGKAKAKSNNREENTAMVKNEVDIDKGKGRSEMVNAICKNCAARSLSCVWPATAWSSKKPNERRACNACSLNKVKCEVEGHEPLRRPRRKVIFDVDAGSGSAKLESPTNPGPSNSKVDVQVSSRVNGEDIEHLVKKMDSLRQRLKDDKEELSNRITSLEVEFTGILKQLANKHHLPDSK